MGPELGINVRFDYFRAVNIQVEIFWIVTHEVTTQKTSTWNMV